MTRVLCLILAAAGFSTAAAQISYTGGLIFQDFDSLPVSGGFSFTGKGPQELDQPPVSAAGLAGWSIYARVGSPLRFLVDAGSLGTASVYSYGLVGEADRALGSLGGAHVANLGLRLVNATGQTLTGFHLVFSGEQWRRGSNSTANVLNFGYRIQATPFNVDSGATFTAVPSLSFATPTAIGVASELNGNLPSNRGERQATVSGLSWPAGSTLVLRWTDLDEAGSDDGLAVDDVAFYAPTSVAAPQVARVRPAEGAVDVPANSRLEVWFDQPVSAPADAFQVAGAVAGPLALAVSGGPLRYTLVPEQPLPAGESVTLTVLAERVGNVQALPMADNAVIRFTTRAAAPNLQPIAAVQGTGPSTPFLGQILSVRGVVTADYQGAPPAFGGFHLQSLPADADAFATSSEGLWVRDFNSPGAADVAVGEVVYVTGTVGESFGLTHLAQILSVTRLGTAALPPPVAITLPPPAGATLEPFEGMRVQLPQVLHVTGNSGDGGFTDLYAREGRLVLAADAPLLQPTERLDPNDDPASGLSSSGSSQVAAITALAEQQERRLLVLDDGTDQVNPDPTPYLNAQGTRRIGDTVTGLTGVLGYTLGRFCLQPDTAVAFADANPRPLQPPARAGRLRVAAMNVLNYFTTFGQRGADNAAEFQRQKDKLVPALVALDADVLGLLEIENQPAARDDLLAALNAAAVDDPYAAVPDPAGGAGADAVRLAFLYRPSRIGLHGACLTDTHAVWNTPNPLRPPLVQRFRERDTGEGFLVCLNHFKSKSASGASGSNLDQGDGQGAWNDLRRQQAARLAEFLAGVSASSGEPEVLILGDLNAYGEEDPVDLLRGLGYADQTVRLGGSPYSYRFGMLRGRLDHALANPPMAAQVVAASHWHINADEPMFYDYNLEGKTAAQQQVNTGTPFRSSDHDPILVDLSPILQPANFAQWVEAQAWAAGADASAAGDPDGDGLVNLAEFAMGTNPQRADSGARPRLVRSGDAVRLEYHHRLTALGVQLQPQWSADLQQWQDMADGGSLGQPSPGIEQRFGTVSSAGRDRLFTRLRLVWP